jgi:LmbE family N-acetylglucosaminyl deacetylase
VLTGPGDIRVVEFFTAGPEPGFVTRPDKLTGANDSAALMQNRLAEDREALALVGKAPLQLGFLDDQYRENAPTTDELKLRLDREVPTAATLYAPAVLGGHIDHELVRALALEYLASGIAVELYADLPYAVRYGWPHTVVGTEPDPHLDVEADWEHYLAPVRDRHSLTRRVHRFAEQDSDAKLRAMRTYQTQFPSLNSGMVDRLANPRIRRYEVFWTVGPSNA